MTSIQLYNQTYLSFIISRFRKDLDGLEIVSLYSMVLLSMVSTISSMLCTRIFCTDFA